MLRRSTRHFPIFVKVGNLLKTIVTGSGVKVTAIALMAVVLFIGLQARCDAYIDPVAGGFLAQILAPLGALAASLFIYFRKQVTALLRRGKSLEGDSSESAASDVEP